MLFLSARAANLLCELKSLSNVKTPDSAKKLFPGIPQLSKKLELNYEEVVSRQHKRLRLWLKNLPASNVMSRTTVHSGGSDLYNVLETERLRLTAEHRAAHEMIRKRLYRSVETTLRYIMDSYISPEEAKNQIKDALQCYQGVVVSFWTRTKNLMSFMLYFSLLALAH